MLDILSQILNFLLSILTGIINAILALGNWIISAILWIINGIISVVTWLFQGIGIVLQFIGDLIVSLVNTFITVVGGIFVVVYMVIETMIHFIIDIVGNIVKIIHIVDLAFQAGIGIAGVVLNYFGQVVNLFFGILANTNGATPVPVAGLPQCVSAPTNWDWCALWYVTDWTVLAPGTPGVAIVPILVLIIDIFILAYIARAIFKLVRWFQSIYQVT